DDVMETFYLFFERLRAAGKTRFLGITERFFADPSHEMLAMALAEDRFETIMVKYGILHQTPEREGLHSARRRGAARRGGAQHGVRAGKAERAQPVGGADRRLEAARAAGARRAAGER